MQARRLSLPDVVEVLPSRHEDARGYFSETFVEKWFDEHVGQVRFVQENQSLSVARGVVRGLHFQTPPHAQGKLVRCVTGAIFDVAVDLREQSATYGKWVAVNLSAAEGNQLWVPAGFAHGFCTLTENAVVAYKVTDYYNAADDAGVAWDDSEIGVTWPDVADPAQLSGKDRTLPRLAQLNQHLFAGSAA